MSDIPYSVRGGRSTTSVAGLTDTTITNLQNQQILKYDSASQKWVNAVDSGGNATISSLGDTLISNPQTNQSLVYNATVSPARWENQPTPFTQSDFTNTVSTDPAFIKHKPIITTTSLATMVGINTGINKEGDLTAFGKGAGYAGKNGHICIGELSGNLGSTRAISLGYNTHATHVNSVVIHGGSGLSSSATNAFYIDPLRTLDALTETVGDMKINMYNTSTKEIFLTNNLLVPGKTKLNGTLEVSNGIGAVNQVLTSNNTGALTWTDKSQLSANVYDLGGLTWSDVNNNEVIRRVDATNADGAGMTLHDMSTATFPQTSYYKDVSYFGRHGLLTIPFGVNRFESTIAGYNQRIIPYSPILLSTTLVSGLYLHHLPSMNDYNVRVGVNIQYPSQDFQVGTTLYVNDTDKKVGIGIVDPDENLEVDGSIQIDSNGAARLKFKKSGVSPHALGEIDGEEDPIGGDGGRLKFYTKTDGVSGNGTEKLRINNVGAIGIGGANYGDEYNILASNGSGNPPEWTNTLNIESIYAGNTTSNTISSFTRVLVKMIQSVFKFYDLAENLLATISSVADGAGGKLRFYTTNATSGLEVNQLTIKESGAFGLGNTEDCGSIGQVLSSNGSGSAVSWISVPISQPKEAFNLRFNNKLNSYGGGLHGIGGYNATTIMAGTNANAGNGRYTATRGIWMNFMFVGLQFNNTGGTNDMSQSIRRFNSGGTLLEECAGQTIPSHADPQNVIQATLSMNVVMYLNAGDYAIGCLGSSRPFLAYSMGVNSNVVFSGHNVD